MKKSLRFLIIAIICGSWLTACYQKSQLVKNNHTEVLADQVWTYSITHPDGFTMDLNTMTTPTEGIVVAYAETQGCHSREKLNYVIDHAMSHNGVVGGWLDTTDSLYYFDSSRIFPEDSLDAAKKFGMKYGQIAIFIISEGREVRLEYETQDQ